MTLSRRALLLAALLAAAVACVAAVDALDPSQSPLASLLSAPSPLAEQPLSLSPSPPLPLGHPLTPVSLHEHHASRRAHEADHGQVKAHEKARAREKRQKGRTGHKDEEPTFENGEEPSEPPTQEQQQGGGEQTQQPQQPASSPGEQYYSSYYQPGGGSRSSPNPSSQRTADSSYSQGGGSGFDYSQYYGRGGAAGAGRGQGSGADTPNRPPKGDAGARASSEAREQQAQDAGQGQGQGFDNAATIRSGAEGSSSNIRASGEMARGFMPQGQNRGGAAALPLDLATLHLANTAATAVSPRAAATLDLHSKKHKKPYGLEKDHKGTPENAASKPAGEEQELNSPYEKKMVDKAHEEDLHETQEKEERKWEKKHDQKERKHDQKEGRKKDEKKEREDRKEKGDGKEDHEKMAATTEQLEQTEQVEQAEQLAQAEQPQQPQQPEQAEQQAAAAEHWKSFGMSFAAAYTPRGVDPKPVKHKSKASLPPTEPKGRRHHDTTKATLRPQTPKHQKDKHTLKKHHDPKKKHRDSLIAAETEVLADKSEKSEKSESEKSDQTGEREYPLHASQEPHSGGDASSPLQEASPDVPHTEEEEGVKGTPEEAEEAREEQEAQEQEAMTPEEQESASQSNSNSTEQASAPPPEQEHIANMNSTSNVTAPEPAATTELQMLPLPSSAAAANAKLEQAEATPRIQQAQWKAEGAGFQSEEEAAAAAVNESGATVASTTDLKQRPEEDPSSPEHQEADAPKGGHPTKDETRKQQKSRALKESKASRRTQRRNEEMAKALRSEDEDAMPKKDRGHGHGNQGHAPPAETAELMDMEGAQPTEEGTTAAGDNTPASAPLEIHRPILTFTKWLLILTAVAVLGASGMLAYRHSKPRAEYESIPFANNV